MFLNRRDFSAHLQSCREFSSDDLTDILINFMDISAFLNTADDVLTIQLARMLLTFWSTLVLETHSKYLSIMMNLDASLMS